MEKTTPASSTNIPTVDLSPFMKDGDKSGRKKAMEIISEACANLGIFLIENHGVPLDNCEKLLELSKTFFGYLEEEKIDSTKEDNSISGAGYGKRIDKHHEFEYVLMYTPGIPYNGVPTIQPDYRRVSEEVFKHFVKTSQIIEGIINEYLGLPPNYLHKYNNDRSWDFLLPLYYKPVNEHGDIGVVDHEDPGMLSIILQDDVCGLEVFKEGEWIPITPLKGTLVVIVPDSIRVLSNKKATNVTHRALKNKGSKRLAIDFNYSLGPYIWVEPLKQHATEIGVKPKYRGFVYKEYIDLLVEDMKNPPENAEDYKDISYFEI